MKVILFVGFLVAFVEHAVSLQLPTIDQLSNNGGQYQGLLVRNTPQFSADSEYNPNFVEQPTSDLNSLIHLASDTIRNTYQAAAPQPRPNPLYLPYILRNPIFPNNLAATDAHLLQTIPTALASGMALLNQVNNPLGNGLNPFVSNFPSSGSPLYPNGYYQGAPIYSNPINPSLYPGLKVPIARGQVDSLVSASSNMNGKHVDEAVPSVSVDGNLSAKN